MMISAAISWYSVAPIISIHGRITASERVDKLDNQVHPMTQTLFQNNDAVFQGDNYHIHSMELFSRGLINVNMNSKISSGQHNNQD
jgi:hypothetical protein